VVEILQRKVIAASVSGSVYNVLLALIWPDPWVKNFESIQSYLFSAMTSIPIYMIYSIPAIFVYGILTSVLSDKIGGLVSVLLRVNRAEFIVSAALHIVFGLILLWFSLGAALLFFITDRILLVLDKEYDWASSLKSLAIPIATWLLFLAVIWGAELL